jgi:O-acetylhomoserine (thiol)-lyase
MPSRASAGRWCWADPDDIASFESQIDDRKTKAIFIESLANPGGTFVDIAAIAAVARKHGVPLIVDNTLATPYLIRPIEHGADIVVHSLTKFLGGHGNSMGGIIVDGGTFDWSKSGKYPMLSEPRPEYHGIVLHETFGNFAFAIACRVLGLRDLGPAISPFNAFLILTGIETLPLRMQRHSDNAKAVAEWLSAIRKVAWVNYSGL